MIPQTNVDHFIFRQVHPTLLPGEQILLCAYLTPVLTGGSTIGTFVRAATRMAAFAALTDRRLILIDTRIGAFQPLLENHGFQSLDRTTLRGVFIGGSLLLQLANGQMLEYENNASRKYTSTQAAFFQQLPHVFGISEEAARAARKRNATSLIALGVGVVLAAAYVWLRLH